MTQTRNQQDTNEVDREDRRTRVARLMVAMERPSVRRITQALEDQGVTVGKTTIHRDMKIIMEEWRADRTEVLDDIVAKELGKLAVVEQEAWTALQLSRQRFQSRTVIVDAENADGDNERPVRITNRTEARTADPRYMKIILDCAERRAKLLGLDQPGVLDLQAGHGGKVAFTLDIGAPTYEERPDVTEAGLAELEEVEKQLESGTLPEDADSDA